MENSKQFCELHQKEIIYICSISAWHCELLCMDCMVTHSQAHLKNQTIANIDNYESFLKKIIEEIGFKRNEYQNILEDYEKYLSTDEEFVLISNKTLQELKRIKLTIYEEIDKKIMSLENIVKKEISKNFLKNKMEIIQKKQEILLVKKELEKHLESFEIKKTNEQILNSIKFASQFINKKENDNEFKEEIKNMLCFELSNNIEINFNGIPKPLFESFESLIKISNTEIVINNPAQIKEKTIKNPLKSYSKICKNCGNEMGYVSEFKKHVTCKQCSSVKRLYEKK